VARYRCSLNRLPRTQKKLPASAGYRGSDLVHWHIASFAAMQWFIGYRGQSGLWQAVRLAHLWVHGL